MVPKRKRIVLNIAQKLEIIKRIKGESRITLASEYSVGASTLCDIMKNESKITNFASTLDSSDGTTDRKILKNTDNNTLDEVLFDWFLQVRSLGHPISGPILQEKALLFNEKLSGSTDFKASNGWLQKFQSRHGIRSLQSSGETLSANIPSAESFKKEFMKIIEEGEYSPHNTYNADETGLLWKLLPSKSLASKREKVVPGPKRSKERVTLLLCSNAAGTNRLPVLLIGKSRTPRCFARLQHELPIVYRNQHNAWMDTKIFTEWFFRVFVPSVKLHNEKYHLPDRALLLLDNAPVHPPVDVLQTEDGNYRTLYLPPNVTSLIQPLDQSIIETFKRNYRKRLLRKLLLGDDGTLMNLSLFWKNFQLLEAAYFVADAWDDVKMETLSRGWSKLWPNDENEGEADEAPEITVNSIQEMLSDITGMEECDIENVAEWLAEDNDDQGYQILSDDELVENALAKEASDDCDEVDSEKQAPIENYAAHSDALKACDSLLSWMHEQKDVSNTEILLVNRLRDKIGDKYQSGLKQSKITEFFQAKAN